MLLNYLVLHFYQPLSLSLSVSLVEFDKGTHKKIACLGKTRILVFEPFFWYDVS